MQKAIFTKIEQITSFDFGSVFSRSIELFKKIWVEGFIHILLIMLVTIPAVIVLYAGMFTILGVNYFMAGPEVMNSQEFDWAMLPSILGLFFLFVLIAAIMQTFSIAIMAHFYRVCKNADMGTNTDTGGYFAYLKNGNFKKILVLSFAVMGITLLAAMLCYLPLFYVIVPMSLILVIFAFNPDLTVKELINASFKMGNKIWLPTFGMLILAGILSQLGMLACGIGFLFTAMFARIPLYYIYKDTIGFDDSTEEITERF